MTSTDHPLRAANAASAFVSFSGELTPERVQRLLGHRSVVDRLGSTLVSLAATLLTGGLIWLMSHLRGIPDLVWLISIPVVVGLFVWLIVSELPFRQRRKWCEWNALLLGEYEAEFFDEGFRLETDQLALLWDYSRITNVDSGLSCVRLSLDTMAMRAILLPVEDAKPQMSARDLQVSLKNRVRAGQSGPAIAEPRHHHPAPLPVDLLLVDRPRVEFAGPLRQRDVVATVEAHLTDQTQKRWQGCLVKGLSVCGALLLVLLIVAWQTGRAVEQEMVIQLIALALVLILFGLSAWWQSSSRKNAEADPDAVACTLSGFVSPDGLCLESQGQSTAVVWEAFEDATVTEDRFVARFWKWDLVILPSNLFTHPDDYAQMLTWVKGKIPVTAGNDHPA